MAAGERDSFLVVEDALLLKIGCWVAITIGGDDVAFGGCKLVVTGSCGWAGGSDGCHWCQLVMSISAWWLVVFSWSVDPWNDSNWWSLLLRVVCHW